MNRASVFLCLCFAHIKSLRKNASSHVRFCLLIRYIDVRLMKPDQFSHIVLPMRDELLRYALRLTGSADSAEDLVQEVMLRLWGDRERLDTVARLRSLAMTMVHNLHIDQQRHECHTTLMPERMEIAVDDRRVELRDENRLIREIVATLPPLQQQIFRMKEIEGYSVDEIMQITGCTADNLRRNLSRARMKIREMYIKTMKGAKQ